MSRLRTGRASVQARADQAIRASRKVLSPSAREAFDHLLVAVRARSSLLCGSRLLAERFRPIEVLSHLARFSSSWVRSPYAWADTTERFHGATASLAEHVFSRYRMPLVLGQVWRGGSTTAEDQWRRRYIAHGAGARLRDLELPIPLTRGMERVFLTQPPHWPLTSALRRAELIDLGAEAPLIEAVLATRLAEDVDHAVFWRTVLQFFVRYQEDLDAQKVGLIVNYVHALRHERVVMGAADTEAASPVDPTFSMRGRTPRSMMTQVLAWQRSVPDRARYRWPASRHLETVSFEDEEGVVWSFVELTNSTALRLEGAAMSHCVGSYVHACLRGNSRIWSLRRQDGPQVRSALTVEVDPRRNRVVQAKGFANRRPTPRTRQLLIEWCARQAPKLELGV